MRNSLPHQHDKSHTVCLQKMCEYHWKKCSNNERDYKLIKLTSYTTHKYFSLHLNPLTHRPQVHQPFMRSNSIIIWVWHIHVIFRKIHHECNSTQGKREAEGEAERKKDKSWNKCSCLHPTLLFHSDLSNTHYLFLSLFSHSPHLPPPSPTHSPPHCPPSILSSPPNLHQKTFKKAAI